MTHRRDETGLTSLHRARDLLKQHAIEKEAKPVYLQEGSRWVTRLRDLILRFVCG